MSFGEGNLHEKCEMYRRQLGGVNAANNRKSQRIRELDAKVDKLKVVNGELCAEINRQERRIRELEDLVRDMDRCLRGHMSCDQCEIRPCRMGERIKELGL